MGVVDDVPDFPEFLTHKVGPLPVWAYAAGGGALLGVVFLYKRGASAQTDTSAAAGAPGTSPFAPSPIVITNPGNMANGTSSVNAPASSAPATNMITLQGSHGVVWGWSVPQRSGLVATLPNGTTLPSAGPPVTGQNWTDGVTSNMWQPVKYSGTTIYIWAPEAQSTGNQGGGGDMVDTLSGSGSPMRFASSHAHPQWVNTGMGGGGLESLSKRTGLPLIRLQALNSHLRASNGNYVNGVTRLA